MLRMEKSAVLAPAVTLASQEDAAGELSAQAADQRGVARDAAEPRREAAREPLLEREAMRVVEDRPERVGIRHVGGDRHRGTARRALAARGQHVADEQRAAAVVAEHPAAGVGIPEVVERQHVPACVARVGVRLHAVGEQVAQVGEELEVVVDLRGPPLLGGVRRRDDSRPR